VKENLDKPFINYDARLSEMYPINEVGNTFKVVKVNAKSENSKTSMESPIYQDDIADDFVKHYVDISEAKAQIPHIIEDVSEESTYDSESSKKRCSSKCKLKIQNFEILMKQKDLEIAQLQVSAYLT